MNEQTARYLVLLAILVVVCILLSFVTTTFFSLATIKNIINQISVQCIVAIGMTVLILTGGIDLSVGMNLMLCGVISATVLNATGSVILGFISSIATGIAVGLLNGFMVGYSNISPFMATLAMQCVCKGVGWTISNATRIMVLDYEAFTWLGQKSIKISESFQLPVVFFLIVVTYLASMLMLNRTAFGKRIYAVGGNPIAARASGINVQRTLLLGYAFAGLCVGIASIVSVGRTVSSQPQAGTSMEFDAITAAVIGGIALTGGIGSLAGTLLGSIMVGVISFNDTAFSLGLTNYGLPDGRYMLGKVMLGLFYLQKCKDEWAEQGEDLGFEELAKLAADADGTCVDLDDPVFQSTEESVVKRITAYLRERGKTPPKTKGEMARCILESLAAQCAKTIRLLEQATGMQYDNIYLGGGGIKNRVLCSSLQRATGKGVVCVAPEITVMGNLLSQLIVQKELCPEEAGELLKETAL